MFEHFDHPHQVMNRSEHLQAQWTAPNISPSGLVVRTFPLNEQLTISQ